MLREEPISTGWLLDRFFGPRVALVVGVITAAGILLLAKNNAFATASLAAALIGIGAGAEAALRRICCRAILVCALFPRCTV